VVTARNAFSGAAPVDVDRRFRDIADSALKNADVQKRRVESSAKLHSNVLDVAGACTIVPLVVPVSQLSFRNGFSIL